MLVATSLEVLLLFTCEQSRDHVTRVLGCVLLLVYFRYSATRAALECLARWLHDRNNPPGGPA